MIKKFICSRCKSTEINHKGYCTECMRIISAQKTLKERKMLQKFRDNPELEKKAIEKYKTIPWNRDALLKAWSVVMEMMENRGGKCNHCRIV